MESGPFRLAFCNESLTDRDNQDLSAFVFDEAYKSKFKKNKFERNHKFAYFNTVLKIKTKLGQNHEGLHKLLFDHQLQKKKNNHHNNQERQRAKSYDGKKIPIEMERISFESQRNGEESRSLRRSVQQINFEGNKNNKNRSNFVSQRKPRLEEVLAQYKQISKKQKQKTESLYNFNQTTQRMFSQFASRINNGIHQQQRRTSHLFHRKHYSKI